MLKNLKTNEVKKRDKKIKMKESEYLSDIKDSVVIGFACGAAAAFFVNKLGEIFTNKKHKSNEERSSMECLVR